MTQKEKDKKYYESTIFQIKEKYPKMDILLESIKLYCIKNKISLINNEYELSIMFKTLSYLHNFGGKSIEVVNNFLDTINEINNYYVEDIVNKFSNFTDNNKNITKYSLKYYLDKLPYFTTFDICEELGVDIVLPKLNKKGEEVDDYFSLSHYIKFELFNNYELDDVIGLLDIYGLKIVKDRIIPTEKISNHLLSPDKKFEMINKNYYEFDIKNISTIKDATYNELLLFVNNKLKINLSHKNLGYYVNSHSNMIETDIITDMFESIKTDNSYDYDNFCYALPYSNKELSTKLFSRWMLCVIQNADPSAPRAEEILYLLSSKQGTGKSYFINEVFLKIFQENNVLANISGIDLNNKDNISTYTENLILFDEENDTLSKAEAKSIKKITSLKNMEYRQLYNKYSEKRKNISTIIGTSNDEHILSDVTGNRRYLILQSNDFFESKNGRYPLKNQRIGFDEINWENVWGYLYYMYKENGLRFLSDEFYINLEEYQDEFRNKSYFESTIRTYVYASEKTTPLSYPVIASKVKDASGIDISKCSANVYGVIFKKLGIEKASNPSKRGLTFYKCNVFEKPPMFQYDSDTIESKIYKNALGDNKENYIKTKLFEDAVPNTHPVYKNINKIDNHDIFDSEIDEDEGLDDFFKTDYLSESSKKSLNSMKNNKK